MQMQHGSCWFPKELSSTPLLEGWLGHPFLTINKVDPRFALSADSPPQATRGNADKKMAMVIDQDGSLDQDEIDLTKCLAPGVYEILCIPKKGV